MITLMLILPSFGSAVFAADDDDPGQTGGQTTTDPVSSVEGSKMNKPSSEDPDPELTNNPAAPALTTTVTLSLPSAETKNVVDIVFVMDKSTSTRFTNFTQTTMDFIEEIDSLGDNIVVKVGVVKFRGKAEDALNGLVEYSESTASTIETAIKTAPSGNGSGLQTGLVVADQILKADTDVPDSNKYVIALTDGKTYIWYNNETDMQPTCIYSQYYTHYAINVYKDPNDVNHTGWVALNQVVSYDLKDYDASNVVKANSTDFTKEQIKAKIKYFATYQELYDSTDKELTTETAYDQKCWYAINGSVPVSDSVNATQYVLTNGSEVYSQSGYASYWKFVPTVGSDCENVKYYDANLFEIVDNGDGTYKCNTHKLNEDSFYQFHINTAQKGAWMAGHKWTEMVGKYNCAAVVYDKWSNQSGLEIFRDFCYWLESDISDYYANVDDTTAVKKMLADIKHDIDYLVASGTVTDNIAEGFTLVIEEGTCPFALTSGGTALNSTTLEEGKKWAFGTADDGGTYPYVVTYDSANNKFDWEINVPVTNSAPVTLTYVLKIDEYSDTATGINTNGTTQLAYTSSDGTTGTYDFTSPKVNFTAYGPYKVEHYKQNDEGGFDLVEADTEENVDLVGKSVEATEKSYPGYVCTETEDTIASGTIKKFNETVLVLKLYYIRPTIDINVFKEWNDNNNKAQKRPGEVTVVLLADGEETDLEVTLSEDNEWTDVFEALYVYDVTTGKEISYTVKEKPVDEYKASIETTEDGIVIKNTYSPGPDTGYRSMLFLLLALQYLCIVLCAYAVVKQKRRLNRK